MTWQLRYLAHSEIGLVRKNNQDSGYASPRLLIVADGMGGAAAGDLASAVAVQQLRRADRGADAEPARGEEMLELLAGSLHNANEKIADLVADDHALEGMGTTVTSAMFDGSQLGIVHIGDSRAYLQRGNELTRLTHDHSWVQSLVDEGKLTAEEAAYHPHRSLLLKVLNGQPQADPDTTLVDLQAGDRLLLCSDGLCGLVEDEEISATLTGYTSLEDILEVLVEAAHREGGVDNITIILADVEEQEQEPTSVPPGQAQEPKEAAEPADDATRANGLGLTSSPDEERVRERGDRPSAVLVVGAAVDRTVPVVPQRSEDEPTIRRELAELATEAPAGEDLPPGLVDKSGEEDDEDAEEAIRYAPRLRPGRRRWLRAVLVVVLVGALLGGGLGAGYAWSRTQYYVGPDGDLVAIHRGLSQNVLGLSLSEVYEVQDIRLDDLPQFYRDRVLRTIPLHTLEEARATSGQLKVAADRCIEQRRVRAAESATPSPTPAPNNSPAATEPVATPGPAATGNPAPNGPVPTPTTPTPLLDKPLDPSEDC